MAQKRIPLVAGNWKMNKLRAEAAELVSAVLRRVPATSTAEVLFCPPFTALSTAREAMCNALPKRLLDDGRPAAQLGAQDLYPGDSGAFTGEISAPMLRDSGCRYVLVGHSERRHVLGEDNETVAAKFAAAIAGGLVPILCVGEREPERLAGEHLSVVAHQLAAALKHLADRTVMPEIALAYEPVWAIGTGRTATPADAQEMHAHIRRDVAERLDGSTAAKVRILYGGSVKPDNARELMARPDVDGVLVGGASLAADAFLGIIAGAEPE
ncbi:MAG: triose-phosphate isomerase [Candidatus Schekmanbacteria bacterium]|nr:triose-phosphate isomerase [Candidatus Schekmanbacteria bacterium]